MIARLIATGEIAPWIIALTVVEIFAIAVFRRWLGGGLGLGDLLPNILAGDFILLAWWLGAAHWLWAAASLSGALVAHCSDMWRRWQKPGRRV